MIEQLAKMARMELSEEEQNAYSTQLASILEYVAKIQALELPPDAPMMMHAGSGENVWREDVAEICDAAVVNELTGAFPELVQQHNAVPAVFDRKKV